MAEKTFLGNEVNFNETPIFWSGMEVYPGGKKNIPANFYGTLNVVKNSQEPNTPDINTDGNINVKKNVKVNGNIDADGNINSRGLLNVSGRAAIGGELYSNDGAHRLSAKKNFDIPHPTKEGWRLTHSCIEGPEAAVYFRGKLINNNIIQIPEYWKNLVDFDTITVSITPIQFSQNIFVKNLYNDKIILESKEEKPIQCFYHVYGERIDTEKLIVEYEGNIEDYPGNNIERSIVGYHYDKK